MRLTKKWWFVIVVLPVIGLCMKAGFWQLDRAHEKERLIDRLTVGQSTLTKPFELMTASLDRGTYQVRLPVRVENPRLIYLDNRIQERVAGYEVFAEVSTIQGGIRLFANLGWVPATDRRNELPKVEIPEQFELDALWVPVTESYYMSDAFEEQFDGAVRVQSLKEVEPIGALSGMFLAKGLLASDALGPTPRLGPATHYGYAVQWFLLSIVLAGLAAYVYRRGLTHG
jgi:cytochrome oxidase assembly protein ShyY1